MGFDLVTIDNKFSRFRTFDEAILNIKNNLKYLDFKLENISHDQISNMFNLLTTLKIPTLHTIDLTDTKLNDASAYCISEFLKSNDSLEDLILAENNITDEGMVQIASALLTNTSLSGLDISGNSISSTSIFSIATALSMGNIKRLVIEGCKMSDDCSQKIAFAISLNKSIECLNLINCEISDNSIVIIANALKNNDMLKYLRLSENSIADEGAFAIADLLARSKSLLILSLSYNLITDKGFEAIAESLKSNVSLMELDISNNLQENFYKNLVNMLEVNNVLISLNGKLTEIINSLIDCNIRVWNNICKNLDKKTNNQKLLHAFMEIFRYSIGYYLKKCYDKSNDEIQMIIKDSIAIYKPLKAAFNDVAKNIHSESVPDDVLKLIANEYLPKGYRAYIKNDSIIKRSL